MAYLVTGGSGFIGSHIVEELLKRGDEVVILDDMSTGHLCPPGAAFVQGSVTDGAILRAVCEKYAIDTVFHLAAVASVAKSVADPVQVHEVNACGTLNVLLAARDCGAEKVVFSASAAAYGDDPVLPKREDMMPRPLSPYAVSKLAGEMYCEVFSRLYGLSTVSLRYFNVFGPRQDPFSGYAAVIPKFMERICAGESPVIFGDGKQTRDFVYVKDVVRANLLAAESGAEGLFNIGCGQQTSLNDLARMIMDAAGLSAEVVYAGVRPGDIRDSAADISRARSVLGFSPEWGVEEGIRETVREYRRVCSKH
jgi:UDP-glucose 4-epimerase